MPVSRELFDLLTECEDWHAVSRGAFNPAVELLSRTWQRAEAMGAEPSAESLGQMVDLVGTRHWQLDPVDATGDSSFERTPVAECDCQRRDSRSSH